MLLIVRGLENQETFALACCHECSWLREVLASWLRNLVGRNYGRTLDAQLLHATPKSVGMEIKNLCGTARAFDYPFGLPKDVQNMPLFN